MTSGRVTRRVLLGGLGAGVALGALSACSSDAQPSTVPLPKGAPLGPTVTAAPGPRKATGGPRVVRTVASGLAVPWGIGFLPDGSALVTERDSGRVLAVSEAGAVREVGSVASEGSQSGESGLLGLAVSPSYAADGLVFLYLTTGSDNRVVRASYDGERLGPLEVIVKGIPSGVIHDGGRLAFGPDRCLFVSTGETGDTDLAQDLGSLGGKILRVNPDGSAPSDNPFRGSLVWSYGHRNIQGLAFDASGQLWASEFGAQTYDELNRIVAGADYGWPQTEGSGGAEAQPAVVWSTDDASPSGLAFAGGRLWLGALQGERLWSVSLDGDTVDDPTDFFVGSYGRLRTVVTTPTGRLWVTTSNRDGRGDPAPTDDRILELALPDPS